MRTVFVCLFFLGCLHSTAQNFSFDRLLSYLNSDENKISDSLKGEGFVSYRKQEDSVFKTYFTYWKYKKDSLAYKIGINIDSKTKLVIELVYGFKNKDQYLSLLSQLSNDGFISQGLNTQNKYWTTEQFMKSNFNVVITVVKLDSNIESFPYQIQISNFAKKAN